MMVIKHRRLAVAILDLTFLCFAAIAVYHLSHKPFIPRDLDSPYPLKVNGTLVSNGEELEFFVSWLEVGDEVIIERPVGSPEQSLHLENFYVTPLIIFDTFIIMMIFGVGTFVFYKRPGEKASFIFHLTSMLVAADIIGTKTLYALKPEWIGYPLSAIYFILYTIVPVMFLHFTFVFPSVRWKNYSRLISILYGLGTMIGLWYAWLYLNAASAQSLELYRSTSTISMLQNGFVFAFILLGVANFIISYKQAPTSTEKKKIRWILYGLSIGPSPYIFLWTLPIALGSSPWIPEVWFKVFILLIPFTFAISILKHHAMDIDLIMNRSTV
ncbi:MAG: hypothetical protein HY800_01050, partial [Ignavibacteriales bacterium]|nr:hypothetical protein [Ignavibacteriales bacterium]